MEIKDGELIFERAFDIEALSSFNCGIRELDQLIHKKNNGLRDFVLHNECDTFFVYYNEILVALFVYSNGTFVTDDGNYEATEIDFLAVRKEYRNNNIGRNIIEKISEYSLINDRGFLTVGSFCNDKYSAQEFYQKCGFEQISEKQGNIVPMFKELL